MIKSSDYLFAYGTLLPPSMLGGPRAATAGMGSAERGKLAAEAQFLGPATTVGSLVDLGCYPGLIDGDAIVHGGVYALYRPGKTLMWLDVYEGLTGGPADEYRRITRTVTMRDGCHLTAWIYLYLGPCVDKPLIAFGRW